MRAGVSSLNLATSVAAVLFAWRLAARRARLTEPPALQAVRTPYRAVRGGRFDAAEQLPVPRNAARARASILSACASASSRSASSSSISAPRRAGVLDVEQLVQP